MTYCVYQWSWVLSNVLFVYVTMHAAAHAQPSASTLRLWTASPRAKPACWTVEFLSFGGVLIQLALFSSGTDYVRISPPPSLCPLPVKTVHRWLGLLCLFHTIVLWWWDVWPNISYLISVQRQGPVWQAGISNHRYSGLREARLTCCISHTRRGLTACML